MAKKSLLLFSMRSCPRPSLTRPRKWKHAQHKPLCIGVRECCTSAQGEARSGHGYRRGFEGSRVSAERLVSMHMGTLSQLVKKEVGTWQLLSTLLFPFLPPHLKMQIPQLATALGALSLALSVSAASSPLKRAAKTFCTPSQPCWPTTAEWNAFNATIGGRLIKVVPWGTYCFASGPTGYDGAKCSAVANSYIDSVVRANTLGTAEQDNWTSCYSDVGDDDDCILNAALPFLQSGSLPYTRTCKLGRLSPYAVETLSPQDAVKAFAFAKERNIRCVEVAGETLV